MFYSMARAAENLSNREIMSLRGITVTYWLEKKGSERSGVYM